MQLLESGHVEEDYLITSFFLKTKDAQTSFFYKKKKNGQITSMNLRALS